MLVILDLRLCPVPTYVEIAGVRIKPKKQAAKPGKIKKIRVKVRNTGTRASKGTVVRLRSSNRKVKVRKEMYKTRRRGKAANAR